MIESERRFLPKNTPTPPGKIRRLRQAYFSKERITIQETLAIWYQGVLQLQVELTPKERTLLLSTDPVVRIRQDGHRWFLTAKGPKKNGIGIEIEKTIDPNTAWNVFQTADAGMIDKTRVEIHHEEILIEIDHFHGQLEGLVIIEVENMPENWNKPHWFGEEITNDHRYSNANLAKGNRPA